MPNEVIELFSKYKKDLYNYWCRLLKVWYMYLHLYFY
jgi:hypothetical protein